MQKSAKSRKSETRFKNGATSVFTLIEAYANNTKWLCSSFGFKDVKDNNTNGL